jgi:signal-transduction protein with cAMP-binding, CBS, and nucleotidyltransferase domain
MAPLWHTYQQDNAIQLALDGAGDQKSSDRHSPSVITDGRMFYYGASAIAHGRLSMYEELLETSPLFRDLPRRELTRLGEGCREREYVVGEELTRQGSGAIGLIFVIEGRVRATTIQGDGLLADLGAHDAGTILGVWVTLEDQFSPTTIVALEPTRVVILPIWDFQATLRDFPEIAIHLLAIAARQLRTISGPTV